MDRFEISFQNTKKRLQWGIFSQIAQFPWSAHWS